MRKTLLTCLFITICLTAFSRMPTNPYFFNAPDFHKLLPFTQLELQELKLREIKTVEKKTETNVKTIYNFNEDGQLIFEEQIWYNTTNEGVNQYVCKYQYNDNGLLTVRHQSSEWNIVYDSITYDDKDRVVTYYSYYQHLKGKKKWRKKNIIFDLSFSSTKNNDYILTDKIDVNFPREFTFNKKNQVVRIQTSHQIDSVFVEWTSENDSIVKYLFKETNDSTFRIGQEFIYKNGYLQCETKWDKIGDGKRIIDKLYYIYDKQNLLLRTEYESTYRKRTFYLYGRVFGTIQRLPFEIIEKENDNASIIKFRYSSFY